MSSKKDEKIEMKLVNEMNKLGENLSRITIEDSFKPAVGELEKVSFFCLIYFVNSRSTTIQKAPCVHVSSVTWTID